MKPNKKKKTLDAWRVVGVKGDTKQRRGRGGLTWGDRRRRERRDMVANIRSDRGFRRRSPKRSLV